MAWWTILDCTMCGVLRSLYWEQPASIVNFPSVLCIEKAIPYTSFLYCPLRRPCYLLPPYCVFKILYCERDPYSVLIFCTIYLRRLYYVLPLCTVYVLRRLPYVWPRRILHLKGCTILTLSPLCAEKAVCAFSFGTL